MRHTIYLRYLAIYAPELYSITVLEEMVLTTVAIAMYEYCCQTVIYSPQTVLKLA